MIDIHCHLLPNVDDGSDSLNLSRQLLINAKKEGINKVCITPHFTRLDNYKYKKNELLPLFNKLVDDTKDIGIKLYLGNELYIDSELDTLLTNNEVCSINDTKYVLVEFPFNIYKDEFDEYLYNISLDYKIIIAHPERYKYVIENNDFVLKWIKRGYLLQSNQNSLFIKENKKVVFNLIEKGYLSFICSDAHNINRPLTLIDAYNLISHKFNIDIANLLFEENSNRVLENKDTIKPFKCKKRLF